MSTQSAKFIYFHLAFKEQVQSQLALANTCLAHDQGDDEVTTLITHREWW